MGVREARARLRLQLVRGDVLGLERERLGEVALEVGGALARDAVDEIERDVVESGITQDGERRAGRRRAAQRDRARRRRRGWKRLRAERDAVDAAARAAAPASSGVTVSGFASTVTSPRAGSAASRRSSARGLGERRRAAAEEDRLELRREQAALELELARAARRRSAPCSSAAADDGDEVAVAAARARRTAGGRRGAVRRSRRQPGVGRGDELAAAVRADVLHRLARTPAQNVHSNEQIVARRRPAASAAPQRSQTRPHLERHRYFFAVSFRLSTARNASCGTSTPPTCFIRFLPSFCFSSSFRLRDDVAAVALREHVLAARLDRLARDHARADRGLDRDVEHLARDLLAQLLDEQPCRARRRSRGG